MKSSIEVLNGVKAIAVVGLSANPERSSYGVAEYLQKHFEVIPVNPMITEWLGQKSYPTLSDIPRKIDLVNIFRRSEEVAPIVDEAISLGIKKIWLQLGVIDEASAAKARQHGIDVVMDECIAVVHHLHSPLR